MIERFSTMFGLFFLIALSFCHDAANGFVQEDVLPIAQISATYPRIEGKEGEKLVDKERVIAVEIRIINDDKANLEKQIRGAVVRRNAERRKEYDAYIKTLPVSKRAKALPFIPIPMPDDSRIALRVLRAEVTLMTEDGFVAFSRNYPVEKAGGGYRVSVKIPAQKRPAPYDRWSYHLRVTGIVSINGIDFTITDELRQDY